MEVMRKVLQFLTVILSLVMAVLLGCMIGQYSIVKYTYSFVTVKCAPGGVQLSIVGKTTSAVVSCGRPGIMLEPEWAVSAW